MLSELSYLYDIMDLHVLHLTVEDSDFLKPSNFDFVCSTTQVQSEVLSDLALKNPQQSELRQFLNGYYTHGDGFQ